jgi:hypothetical protein
MGNIFPQDKKLKETNYINTFEFQKLENLEKIKKIIEKTVYSIAEKQLCKRILYKENNILKSKKVFDFKKLEENEKEYYIPYNIDKNEYIALNKKEYVLMLFRVIEQYIPGININNIISSKLNIQNKQNEHCNIVIRLTYAETSNNLNDKYYFSLVIPKYLNDDLIQKYEHYLSKQYKQHEISNFIQILKKNTRQGGYIQTYENVNYVLDMDTTDDNLKFSFLSLFIFLIILCENNFLFIGLNLDYIDLTVPYPKLEPDSHRNQILIQKEYDFFKKLININLFQYEPHGTQKGFSYNRFKIHNFYKKIDLIRNDLINKNYSKLFLVNLNFNLNDAVCNIGAQELSAGVDIGYCTVFSTLWFNIFVNVLDLINTYDKKYNYLYYNRLSNIPIKDWIFEIDNHITSLKYDYIIKYSNNTYELDYLFKLKLYMFNDDFSGLDKNITDNYLKFLLDNFKMNFYLNFKSKKPNKDKISVDEFLNMYDEILDEFYNSLTNNYHKIIIKQEFDKIKNEKYKLKKYDYFNIFVNYAYNLFITMYNPSKEYKELYPEEYKNNIEILNEFLNNEEFMEYNRKKYKNYKIVLKPQDYSYLNEIKDYNEMLDKYTTDIKKGSDISQTKYELKRKADFTDDDDLLTYIFDPEHNYKNYDIRLQRKKDLDNLGHESEEERNKIYIECNDNSDCKKINTNLNCEYDNNEGYNICKPNDKIKEIGDKCNKNEDCLSNYCKEYTKTIKDQTKTIGICRKKI